MEKKIPKSIKMKKSTVKLLNEVTHRKKAEDSKYTFEDAILEGLRLITEKEKEDDVNSKST